MIEFGSKFGRWNVITETKKESGGRLRPSVWCVCECGTLKNVYRSHLLSGLSVSCGCYQKEKASEASRKHLLSKSPEYKVWQGMKGRCHNPTHADYYNYGARGISVSQEWRDSFDRFLEDMGKRPSDKHTIERLDNDKGYCKENCCWLLRVDQAKNKRKERRSAGTSPNYEIKRQAYLRRKEREAATQESSDSYN